MAEEKYALCIKCKQPLVEVGFLPLGSDLIGDGFYVTSCDNKECDRYGLITMVNK